MAQPGWRCPTCGATNAFGNRRCRICQLLVPPALLPSSPPASDTPDASAGPHAYQPYQPYEPYQPPSPEPVATGYAPIGTVAAPPPPSSLRAGPLPPPPMPSGGYPMPPPGWYPGAPPRKQRRAWIIVVSVVVPVLILAAIGLLFGRSTDPGAAQDRDAAEKALLTNSDLGGTFREVGHRTFARSRAGMRVDEDIAECGAADSAFEKDGQAVVDSVLQSQNGLAAQVLAEEVMVVGSADSATPVVDSMVGTLRSCVSAGLSKGAGRAVDLQLSASPAPDLGNRVAAFDGSASLNGVTLSVDILIVQQGRAIVLLMGFDTTGSFSSTLESSMRTVTGRLASRFGT